MASFTVTSTGYWGDPALGNWSGLARGDTVTVQASIVVNPSVRIPTNISTGVNITSIDNFATVKLINTSTTSGYVYYGNYAGALRIESGNSFITSGNYIIFGSGNGLANHTVSGWTSIGYSAKDEPGSLEIEQTPGSGDYIPWLSLGDCNFGEIGVGKLGNFYSFNTTTGVITFGDNGKPQLLSSGSLAGSNTIEVFDATSFNIGNTIHIIQSESIRNTAIIDAKSGNKLTVTNAFIGLSGVEYNYSSGVAFIRLTEGGNIPASGAAIRTYSIGLGCKDAGGPVFATIAANNYETDISPGGNLILNKTNLFGFYVTTGGGSVINFKNISSVINLFFQRVTGAICHNLCVAIDRYTTTEVTSVNFSDSSNCDINGIYCARKYHYGILFQSLNDSYIQNCSSYMLRRTSSARSAIQFSSTINTTIKNSLIAGGVMVLTGNVIVSGVYYSDQPKGYPTGSGNLRHVIAAGTEVSINDMRMLEDGCIVAGIPVGNGCVEIKNSEIKTNYTYCWEPSAGLPIKFKNVEFYNGGIILVSEGVVTHSVTYLNCTIKNFSRLPNGSYLGNNCILKHIDSNSRNILPVAGQDSHFYEIRTSVNSGCMGLFFQPKNIENGYTISNEENIVFNNAGRMYGLASGWIEWEWPHWVIGISGFDPDGTIIKSGAGTVDNFSGMYKIDTGTGYNADWLPISIPSLSSHTINPLTGFRFKVRIDKPNGNLTDYLNVYNWPTLVDYETYKYPEDEVTITLQNIKDGSEYYIYNQTTSKVLALGTQSGTNDIVITSIPYNGVDESILIRVRKSSSSPKYLPFETNAILNSMGASAWISQVLDRIAS